MRKIILLTAILFTSLISAQRIGADVIKFSGKVTTTVRDGLNVPTGETWLIYNVTTLQFEKGDDNGNWEPFTGAGDGDVVSVNGKVGEVVLNPDDLNDTSTSNKFMTASLLSKLESIETGAEVNVQSDWNAVSGDARILNKPILGELAQKDDISASDILGEGINGQVLTTNGAGEVVWANKGASSFEDLDGDPYDNANLESALNAKANDNQVIKIDPNSLISPLKLAVSDSTTIASGIFSPNTVVIDTTTRTPGGDKFVTNGNLSGAGVLTLNRNYGSPIQITGFATGNFVDLTTNQSIGGIKTFTNVVRQSLPIGSNTGFGTGVFNSNTTGSNITAFGSGTMVGNTTGINNSSFGSGSSQKNTTGSHNTANGAYSLQESISGSSNTANGAYSLRDIISGSHNTAIGYYSGRYISSGTDPNLTGSNSTFIGSQTRALADGQTNQTVIGYNAIGGGSNTVTLGNSSITTLRAQVTSITALSDARDKTGVDYIHNALRIVESLNPVIFTWNQRDGGKVGKKATGFLAQELLETQNNSEIGEYLDLVDETNPDRLEARYGHLIPLMVKAIQELQARIIELENR